MGTLIILEGGDGSGKATQTKLLVERLIKEGHAVKSVSFPNYDSGAAMPIKMYLAGEFGKDVHDVNPYVASSMYAIDRFASFRTDWEEFYKMGASLLQIAIRRLIWYTKWLNTMIQRNVLHFWIGLKTLNLTNLLCPHLMRYVS